MSVKRGETMPKLVEMMKFKWYVDEFQVIESSGGVVDTYL